MAVEATTTARPTGQINRDRLFIGGVWAEPCGAGAIEVIDSTTEEVMGHVPEGSAADVDAAVAAAAAAFEVWSRRSLEERVEIVTAAGALLSQRAEEIASLISREVGMPLVLSRLIQAGLPAMTFNSVAAIVEQVQWQEQTGNSMIVREPVGVVGCITPWNYPLHQIAAKVAPALAAGCTVVIKPSEVAPLNAFLLAEVLAEAGLPDGAFNLVTGYGQVVGEAMSAHPGIDMISFTGSTRAGRRVSEVASATVKRVSLELGGKSANILLDDADLERAVVDGVNKCFLNSGQTCSALTRMLVPREKLETVEQIAATAARQMQPADPFEETAMLGPLVSHAQLDRVRGYIDAGIEEGADLVCGGSGQPEGLARGYFVQPTVFSNVKNSMRIAQEEIFGPVLSIIPYDTEQEAIEIANDSDYGLNGGVWSADQERAIEVARQIRTGQVEINGGAFNPLAPFGGYKQSGHGRELGKFGLEEFLQVKSLQL